MTAQGPLGLPVAWTGAPALAVGAIALLGLVVAAVELSHRLASGSKLALPGAGSGTDKAATEAIIVLGYPSRRRGGTHPLQRWRCQIAVRSMHPGRSSTLIMTGSATTGRRSEAKVMASYAQRVLGVPAEQIVLEEQARTTWENMKHSLPLAERFAVIKIASDPLQARRARRYLSEIRPDLVPRLEPAAYYRPFEHWALKAGTLAYEAYLGARLRLLPAAARPAAAAAPALAEDVAQPGPGERI
jgi:uncharacterized SAM-binding protein YcdF (DUF218 family)